MATTEPQQEKQLEPLDKLERQLELPHVPGELSSWIDGIVSLTHAAKEYIAHLIGNEHEQAYEETLQNDMDLAARVEQMRGEDQAILCEVDKLIKEAEDLDRVVDEGVTAEQQFQPKRTRLADDGLALVVRIHKQRSAVTTWHGESIRRDNGGMGD